VSGTLWIIGPEVDEALRDACRGIEPILGDGAVTLLPGVLVARWLGPACEPGREWFSRLWACVRPALTGLSAATPRIWNT
jgi:urease accessory protein